MNKPAINIYKGDSSNDFISVIMRDNQNKTNNSIPEYHFHDTTQIVILTKGKIDIMINDTLHNISSPALLIFGSDLPHGIQRLSNSIYGIIIQIPNNTLNWATNIPKMSKSMDFIEHCRNGFLFQNPNLVTKASYIARKIKSSEGFKSLKLLFELLNYLEKEDARTQLTLNYNNTSTSKKTKSLSSVQLTYDFIYKNYNNSISLEYLAEYANINATALCRAFKKHSGLSIFQFLNNVRIERACQLINTSDLTISEIAFQVGYNTFSHFNNQFSRKIGMSPSEYRKTT